jgi:hypothetical protein
VDLNREIGCNMGKTWRRERYESDENPSRGFGKNQKRCWVEQEIIDEFGHDYAVVDASEHEGEWEESEINK